MSIGYADQVTKEKRETVTEFGRVAPVAAGDAPLTFSLSPLFLHRFLASAAPIK